MAASMYPVIQLHVVCLLRLTILSYPAEGAKCKRYRHIEAVHADAVLTFWALTQSSGAFAGIMARSNKNSAQAEEARWHG